MLDREFRIGEVNYAVLVNSKNTKQKKRHPYSDVFNVLNFLRIQVT